MFLEVGSMQARSSLSHRESRMSSNFNLASKFERVFIGFTGLKQSCLLVGQVGRTLSCLLQSRQQIALSLCEFHTK
jgi:hypothetical protein